MSKSLFFFFALSKNWRFSIDWLCCLAASAHNVYAPKCTLNFIVAAHCTYEWRVSHARGKVIDISDRLTFLRRGTFFFRCDTRLGQTHIPRNAEREFYRCVRFLSFIYEWPGNTDRVTSRKISSVTSVSAVLITVVNLPSVNFICLAC